jgi:hypothetical protein
MLLLSAIGATCLGLASCPAGPAVESLTSAHCSTETYARSGENAAQADRQAGRMGWILDVAPDSGCAGSVLFVQSTETRNPPPLSTIPGTPAPVVNACRASILAAARSQNPVHVDAVSAGRAIRGSDGVLRAPLEVQIIYSRNGEQEIRQSQVECLVGEDGVVIALESGGDRRDDATVEAAPAQREAREPIEERLPPSQLDGGEVVEAFYRALGAGDGAAASEYIVPEKRTEGPLSASAMSSYFGSLTRPLRAERIIREDAQQFGVRYSYAIGNRNCTGSSRVRLTNRGGMTYIESIRASEDCS